MNGQDELATRLGQVRHFRGLPKTDLGAIVSAGKVVQAPSDQFVLREGDPCAGLFVLLKGRVHLCKLGPQGQETILAVVRPVIMFNEVAALDGGSNPVTAIVIDDSLLWRIGHEDFKALLMRYPQISQGLASVLATRNRFLVEQIEDLSFRTVLARTAKLLLEISDYGSKEIDRVRHPNVDLAARIATVPEAFSRSLHVFKKNGCIEADRATLIIQNPDLLARMADVSPDLPAE